MAKLKVPSAQHLARNWNNDPSRICRDLVKLARNPPRFNYNPLFSAAVDILVFRQDCNQVAEGIRRAVASDSLRNNYLEIVPLISEYFCSIEPDYVNQVEPRYFPIGRGLQIPFKPPMVYGLNGCLFLPWFSFWKTNPLASKQLSLFVSIVRDVMSNDPDFDDAGFQILDFSAPRSSGTRELAVSDTKEIPSLPQSEIREMLDIFAEGYSLAQGILENEPTAAKEQASEMGDIDDRQSSLFDSDR